MVHAWLSDRVRGEDDVTVEIGETVITNRVFKTKIIAANDIGIVIGTERGKAAMFIPHGQIKCIIYKPKVKDDGK